MHVKRCGLPDGPQSSVSHFAKCVPRPHGVGSVNEQCLSLQCFKDHRKRPGCETKCEGHSFTPPFCRSTLFDACLVACLSACREVAGASSASSSGGVLAPLDLEALPRRSFNPSQISLPGTQVCLGIFPGARVPPVVPGGISLADIIAVLRVRITVNAGRWFPPSVTFSGRHLGKSGASHVGPHRDRPLPYSTDCAEEQN